MSRPPHPTHKLPLAPCSYRLPGGDGTRYRCSLAQQIMGLRDAAECRVEAAACDACGRLEAPSAARPNAVVSSLVYGIARRIRQQQDGTQCDLGQAWQAQCYVRSTLAEERGAEKDGVEPVFPPGAREAPGWKGSERKRSHLPRVGLVGYASASGLGQLNRDLAEHRGVDHWLVVEHPHFPSVDVSTSRCTVQRFDASDQLEKLRRWLSHLDWVVWAETCAVPGLPQLARQAGVSTACVPMWELISPADRWLHDVDLMVCPTQQAHQMFADWKRRFGFRWRVERFPWPISAHRFRFRNRQRCQRFLFVNGHGGAPARCIETNRPLGRRKGLDIVLAAARLAPEIPWIVHTQQRVVADVPRNVRIHDSVADHALLYDQGDVCVQPSRWEGVGLPLLECQAAGMPLVTTNAAPMNEYRPLRSVAPSAWAWGYLCDGQPIPVPAIAPAALADTVRGLYGQDIREASLRSRDWVSRERSWKTAVDRWRQLFHTCPSPLVSDGDDTADA